MSNEPNYITRQGARRLQEELVELRTKKRPKVVQDVADAAAQGDRSENAEYIYGKKKLAEIDRRLRFLGKRLEALTVVHDPPREDGRVYFGTWVTLSDPDGEEVTYRIVGADETDAEAGFISVDSPVGRALLGREEGDEVTVDRPKGRVKFEIVRVRVTAPR